MASAHLQNSFPSSLYKICLSFVSKNIGCVESFCGFPPSIGKEIFEECLMKGSLLENNLMTCSAVEKLADAYSSEFVTSLKCNDRWICDDYGDVLSRLILPIQRLDLSHSALGDNHVILERLHNLQHLKVLCLKNVNLTEVGWRKIFLPAKVLGGFPLLESLDASENLMGSSSLKLILRCKSLIYICLSFVKMHKAKRNSLQDMLNSLKDNKFRIDVSTETLSFQNCGWGTSLLSKWREKMEEEVDDLQKARERVAVSDLEETGPSSHSLPSNQFYRKRRFLKSLSLASKDGASQPPLHSVEYESFTYKRKLCCENIPDSDSGKRKCDSAQELKNKRRALRDVNSDLDLIKSYL